MSAPFPLNLAETFGTLGMYLIYLLIGVGFGVALEMAGFGKSTKLAAQFYFKDLTVLKVMFTAIVVAMTLIFLMTALGVLDFSQVWVNPTYLWPGIVGGLIMGAGFIIGGFCPGTSLVAAATLKLDGIFFALGAFFGIFVFGESVGLFDEFFNSSNYGRLTIPDLLGVDAGIVVVVIVAAALLIFFGADFLEKRFGNADVKARHPKWRFGAAGTLFAGAFAVALIGQPTTADKWASIAAEKEQLLKDRQVQIDPGELLDLMHNTHVRVKILDVRGETDYNLFHIRDAVHVPLERLPEVIPSLYLEPANTVFVVTSNDETAATEAWKLLTAESVPNAYILEGGINNWVTRYADMGFKVNQLRAVQGDDVLYYAFPQALGTRYPFASPLESQSTVEYDKKVTLKTAGSLKGGCG